MSARLMIKVSEKDIPAEYLHTMLRNGLLRPPRDMN